MKQARDADLRLKLGPNLNFCRPCFRPSRPRRTHTFQKIELLQGRRCASGRCALAGTIFTVVVVLWMLALALQFGTGVLPLLLVVGTIFLLMKQVLRNSSFI